VHRPGNHLPREVGESLTLEERVWGLDWHASFPYRERILFDPHELEAELRATVNEKKVPVTSFSFRRRLWPTR
jgi:hypothetical protein